MDLSRQKGMASSSVPPGTPNRRGPPLTARGFREKEELRMAFLRCRRTTTATATNNSEDSSNLSHSSDSQPTTKKRKQQYCEHLPQGEKKSVSSCEQKKKKLKDSTASQQGKQPEPPIPTILEEEESLGMTVHPKEMDCICDRGHGANERQGNTTFRRLVKEHVPQYQRAHCRREKKKIFQQIVNSFQSSSGRFLRKDKNRQCWYVLNDREARAKVGQQIRYQINANGSKLQETEECTIQVHEEEDTSEDGIQLIPSLTANYALQKRISFMGADELEAEIASNCEDEEEIISTESL